MRKFINQAERLSVSQIFGAVLLFLGVSTLLILGMIQWAAQRPNETDISSLMAIGFFLIMLGIAFFFPDMLKSNNVTSTMRVAIYMIISVFVFLCVKIGWNCSSFEKFELNSNWTYLIGIALGSKAVQSFSENRLGANLNTNGLAPGPLRNTGPSPGQGPSPLPNAFVPLHDSSTIGNPPPAGPPAFITQNKQS
jgi:hypothetical protein